MPIGDRDSKKSVNQVIRKWMAANVSWHCLHRGSENMALLVKTYMLLVERPKDA